MYQLNDRKKKYTKNSVNLFRSPTFHRMAYYYTSFHSCIVFCGFFRFSFLSASALFWGLHHVCWRVGVGLFLHILFGFLILFCLHFIHAYLHNTLVMG